MTRAKVTTEIVWVVRCLDFETKPLRTFEDAERQLAAIEKLGACSHEHSIEPIRQKLQESR